MPGGWIELLVPAAVFLLASAVQAVTGFGFALVAVPLLALTLDPVPAVAATNILSVAISLVVAGADRDHVRWRQAWWVSIAGIVAMPLGLLLITEVSERLLTAVIAVVLLASTALVAFGARLPAGRGTDVGVGVVSGALLTSTGMNGPPVVVAFQAEGLAPRPFRGTLSTVFVIQGVAGVALMALVGQVAVEALWAALVGLPMVWLGWVVGNRVFRGLDPEPFRRIVLAMLVVTAVVALASAARG